MLPVKWLMSWKLALTRLQAAMDSQGMVGVKFKDICTT